jgi:hypothetical protein
MFPIVPIWEIAEERNISNDQLLHDHIARVD